MKPTETLILLIVTVCLAYGVGFLISYLENLRSRLNYARYVQKEFIGAYLDASFHIAENRLERVHAIARNSHEKGVKVPLFELTKLIVESQEEILKSAMGYTIPFLFDLFDEGKKEKDPEVVYGKVHAFIAVRGNTKLTADVLKTYDKMVDHFYASGTVDERAEELIKISEHMAATGCVEGDLFYTFAVKVRDAANLI